MLHYGEKQASKQTQITKTNKNPSKKKKSEYLDIQIIFETLCTLFFSPFAVQLS